MSRTVFLGTSPFAAIVLRRLAASPHTPSLVLTPPDRPQGRGRRLLPPPAAAAAAQLGLELLQTADVNDSATLGAIRSRSPEVAAVCAFGQLIREPLLSELEMLNVHPSLLPRWRGAAPIERAIMAGDETTGVSVMRVTAGLDSGPVAQHEQTPIEEDEDFGSLGARLAEIGAELLVRSLELREAGELRFTEQDDERATYAEKIEPAERRIDPARPAPELARKVRALTPHIGAYVELDGGERLAVRRARAEDPAGTGAVEPGELSADGDALRLGCAEGVLLLEVVQPSGGRPMDAGAYLRGHAPARRVM